MSTGIPELPARSGWFLRTLYWQPYRQFKNAAADSVDFLTTAKRWAGPGAVGIPSTGRIAVTATSFLYEPARSDFLIGARSLAIPRSEITKISTRSRRFTKILTLTLADGRVVSFSCTEADQAALALRGEPQPT